jgi:hypothetical protein
MLVFLAIPLVLPYVLADMFPEITEAMKETPVGFVVARPSGLEPQWVLNIGGSAEAPKHGNAELDSPALPEPSVQQPVTPAAGSAINSPGVQKPAGSTPSSDTNPNKSAASAGSVPIPKPNLEDGIPGETRIHGGLVIPLFVVILSVTGGAINMTRKLPIAQHEAAALGSPLQGLAQVGRAVRSRMTGAKDTVVMDINPVAPPPAPAPAQVNAVAIHTQTSGTDTTVAVEQSTDTGGSTEGTLTEQTAQWRQSLITQHMYLLSAPFLAIAVYYVLDWLQLSSKVPILVIVSFSVGLISDKILGTILGLAETFVDKGEPPAGGDSTRTTVKVAAAASGK